MAGTPGVIFVGWIGEAAEPTTLVEEVAAHVGREFEMRAVRWQLGSRPHQAFDPGRHQHSSRVVLAWLAERLPAPAAKAIAITDVDLFIPVLTFVFGEAQLHGGAAVVSTFRLGDPVRDRLRARLRKEAVHELGHTFGLVHCTTPACVMTRSPAVAAVDAKYERLCGDCRIRYRERVKEQGYGATNPENPHRR